MRRKFKYEFGRHTAPSYHGTMPGELGHSETPVFDTYDFMMRTLGEMQSDEFHDDVPVMSRAGWDR